MIMNNTNKDQSIQLLRIIATLLVVVGHSEFLAINTNLSQMGIDWRSAIQNSTFVGHITNILTVLIYSFHMQLFVFISGWVFALCLKSGKYGSFKYLIKNKFYRLVIPYIAVTIFYNIPILGFAGYFSKTDSNTLYNIFMYIIGYGKNHLWFLCTLFFIFILMYRLSILSVFHSKKNKFLIIMIAISLLMYGLSRMSVFQSIEIFYFDRVLQYSIWFAFGFAGYIFKDSIFKTVNRFPFATILMTGIIWLSCVFFRDHSHYMLISELCRFFGSFFGISQALLLYFMRIIVQIIIPVLIGLTIERIKIMILPKKDS